MPKSKELLSSSDESGSGSSEEEKKSKKKRKAEKPKEEKSESSKKPKQSKEDEEEPTWDIAPNKAVKVRSFKGKLYVDIRETYIDKSGDVKPGKKGIAMDMKTWRKFMENVEEIDRVAKAKC